MNGTERDNLLKKIPKGWRKVVGPFVSVLCEMGADVRQIKEKFGGVRVYYRWDNAPEVSRDMREVLGWALMAIETQTLRTCIVCGDTKARQVRDGWVLPLCEKHAKELGRNWETAYCPEVGLVTDAYKLEEST